MAQLRNKFKKCVSECKQAALTLKTATGIKRFQTECGFGNWFNALFDLVKSRYLCKPELALEPSSLDQQSTDDTANDKTKDNLFIPFKKKPKLKPIEKLSETAVEAMNVVKDSLKNDPSKDLIAFMREEMDKSQEHKLKLVGLMQGFRQSNMPFQSPPQFQPVPGMPFEQGSLVSTTNYPTWNVAIGSRNQPTAYQNSHVRSRTTDSESTSFHHDGNTYLPTLKKFFAGDSISIETESYPPPRPISEKRKYKKFKATHLIRMFFKRTSCETD